MAKLTENTKSTFAEGNGAKPYWQRLVDYGSAVYDMSTGKQYLMGELVPVYASGSNHVFDFQHTKTGESVYAKSLRKVGDWTVRSI